MANLLAELKRRNLFRVAAAYAVVAWVLIQLVSNVSPMLRLPDWAGTLVLVLLLVGFPIALLFAWIHQLAPTDGALGTAAVGKLDWFLAGALVIVIGLVSYEQLEPSTGARTAQQQTNVAPGGVSIAVLPFVNLSSDKEQEFFSDGMTEEITSALAKVPSLRVVGRTSAFQFKGENKDLRAIGQALGASHLIEGSVRKDGNQVRITAQLIKVDDGTHLWTESYNRELKGVFALQEEIASAIAGALQVPLGLGQGETLVSNRTNDLESYQQYLRARALLRARSIAEAIKLLEQVVARDASYAPAWALLARAYELAPGYSSEVRSGTLEEARRFIQSSQGNAEKAAAEAIRLDSRSVESYGALAGLQAQRGKWAAFEDLYKQALALDPADPEALHSYSNILASTGRLRDAMNLREKLRTVEPFVPIYNIITASIMQNIGLSRATIPILEAIPADAAGGYYRNLYLAQAYAAEGRYAEAADTLLLISGNQVSRKSVEDAARLLRSAPAAKVTEAVSELEGDLNFIYPYVGAPDRILEFPRRLIELRYLGTPGTRNLWLPQHAPVRKTERFKAYARNAGLVDYWSERGWPDLCRPVGSNDFVCD